MIGVKKQSGTTLFELMITITVFSIFITVGVELLSSALKNHQQALAKAEVLNQTSYALEYISRSLRMAQKDLTGSCITTKSNFENPGGNPSVIRFINYQDKCTEFLTRDIEQNSKTYTIIMLRKSTDKTSSNLGPEVALTAIGPSVNKLYFIITGESQSDTLQPSVSAALEIKDSLSSPKSFNIQTTVSQRELDVEY